jgi:diaminohydroxyphosphoribosylaminopyrimidine deaminase / 5-amino-6-(5-phosphoribosylamino)uracil reductase
LDAKGCRPVPTLSPSETAFSVGTVIVYADGHEIATGYSRETDTHVHAEECALRKLPGDDPSLTGATVYSTPEPCTQRKSRPAPCTELLLRAGVRRVVIAWREPDPFVADYTGVEMLSDAGLEVTEDPELTNEARA